MRREPERATWRWLLFVALVVAAAAVARYAWVERTAPEGFLERSSAPLATGEVRGRAIVHARAKGPALCSVIHEHWRTCGKSKCWAEIETLQTADGTLEVAEGRQIALRPSFSIEPDDPVHEYGEPTTRRAELLELGSATNFGANDFGSPANDRIREWCVPDGATVWVSTCPVDDVAGGCGDRGAWTLALGDGTPALAHNVHADHTAALLAIAFALWTLAIVTLLRFGAPLARPLSRFDQDPGPWRFAGPVLLAWAAVVGVAVRYYPLGSADPMTRAGWSYRGPFAMLVVATLAACIAIVVGERRAAVGRALRRVRTAVAQKLAECDGRVAVFVRAEPTEKLASVVDERALALVRSTLSEASETGKAARVDLVSGPTITPELVAVTDGTTNGFLAIEKQVALDVEKVSIDVDELSHPRRARFRYPSPRFRHRHWTIDEERIQPGEELLVFGDVVSVDVRAGSTGYRSTVRVPTIGSGSTPLTIYAGTREQLERELAHEARRGSLIVGLYVATLLAAAVVTLFLQRG